MLSSYRTNVSFIITLLSSICSPTLREIHIRIQLAFGPERLSELAWAAIDNLAAERTWGHSLKRVIIVLTPSKLFSHSREDFMAISEQIIYPGLFRIAKRGLLDVRYSST